MKLPFRIIGVIAIFMFFSVINSFVSFFDFFTPNYSGIILKYYSLIPNLMFSIPLIIAINILLFSHITITNQGISKGGLLFRKKLLWNEVLDKKIIQDQLHFNYAPTSKGVTFEKNYSKTIEFTTNKGKFLIPLAGFEKQDELIKTIEMFTGSMKRNDDKETISTETISTESKINYDKITEDNKDVFWMIIAIVFTFIFSIFGLIFSILGYKKSKKKPNKNICGVLIGINSFFIIVEAIIIYIIFVAAKPLIG